METVDVEVEVESLLLDLRNPRIGTVASQSEALAAIISLDTRHFKTMMESIKAHGLDPGDAFYLIESDDGDDYVVVDGNRRLAALKVLREPALLQGIELQDAVRTRLAKAAAGFDRTQLRTVDGVLFDDRPSADEWVLRRHGRGLEGESRIPWGSLEVQRFQRDRTLLDILLFVEKNSTFSEDRWSHIKGEVEKRPSALKRFIDSKPLKKLLGITTAISEDGEVVPSVGVNTKDALVVLSQIFEDIADGGIDTRTHNTADEIQEYLDELPTRVKPSKFSQKFQDIEIRDKEKRPRQHARVVPTPVKKQTRPKVPRRTLAPARHPFKQPPHPKGQRLLYEASRLRLSALPLSSAFILRAFLEYTIEVYMTSNRMQFVDRKGNELSMTARAEHVMQHLVDNKLATLYDLRGVKRTLTVATDPASIQALNDYHHNRFQMPTGDTLRAAWDSAEPLFVAVFGSP
jgi:hypothetical protein